MTRSDHITHAFSSKQIDILIEIVHNRVLNCINNSLNEEERHALFLLLKAKSKYSQVDMRQYGFSEENLIDFPY